MSDYNINALEEWNEQIEKLVEAAGLDCYEQHFEICSYEDMLCYEAYLGIPSHYPHWSFGKAYDRQKSLYQYNVVGLPYELVINSNPCIAYLMKDNTLLTQILTMAHVYGHNDFFKNNRLFKRDTRADMEVDMFKTHANRIREYIQDPSIGPDKVERILNAAHGLKFQVSRTGEGKQPSKVQRNLEGNQPVPERLQGDLLAFLAERGNLTEWERDLINIVRRESIYFIPQIETKIMNEGWASYWHYQLMNQLGLPQGLHLEFLKLHNLVICPHQGRINPYFVGFKIFEYLDKQPGGRKKIMEIRAEDRDQSFIRRYLNQQLCEELQLFSYGIQNDNIVVTEVSNEDGWRAVRDNLANSVGLGSIPVIQPLSVENGALVLEHIYDNRELELKHAQETIKYVVDLWGGKVDLRTKIDNDIKIIRCSEAKIVTVHSC
jgi:stage V sporulation protein R